MKSEDMLVYLGYFAVAAIALHFILAVLKVQSDYIYNTSIGFPNDNKLQGSTIEGFQEGFTGEFNEKEKDQLTKGGEKMDVLLQTLEKDRFESKRKRIKSCPSDTMEVIKDSIDFLDEANVLNALESLMQTIQTDKTGDKTLNSMERKGSSFQKILNNPKQREILMKYLDGKDAGGGGGGGGGGYF
jgi:hypothetical protein